MKELIGGYFEFMLDLEDRTYKTIYDSVKDYFKCMFTGKDLEMAAEMSTQAIIHQMIMHHAEKTGTTFKKVMEDIIQMEKSAQELKENN